MLDFEPVLHFPTKHKDGTGSESGKLSDPKAMLDSMYGLDTSRARVGINVENQKN